MNDHRSINTNHRGDKNRMRPSIILGRVVIGGKVISEGVKVRGRESKPHKMHGTLNRPIWVNVKQPDGSFTQKLEKVKIALRKGLIKTV